MLTARALLGLLLLAGATGAQIIHVWDLGDAGQPGQMTVHNPDVNDAQFGTPAMDRPTTAPTPGKSASISAVVALRDGWI